MVANKKGKQKATSELESQMTNGQRMLDEEFFESNQILKDNEDSASEFEEERDDLLLEKLKSLDGKKIKKLRTEAVRGELDVNITSNNGEASVSKIKTYEILNSLKNLSESGTLKKVLAKAHKRTKVLETPLPKHLSEKAQRISAYLDEKKEVSKWDPIVQKNRRAEQLVFPLKQPDFSMQTANVFTQSWKPETELEKQVAEILQSSENNLKDQKLLTEAELKAIKAMNLDEMRQKRAEFLKLKAMQSYQEAKFKRLKGIKSKRYRRLLKKDREKQEEKKMKEMEKDDPVQFKEVLENMQRERIKERMSLKHKNTSKWAKNLQTYAKYDEKARDQIQEQLDLSKKLTKKLKQFEVVSSEDEEMGTEEKVTAGSLEQQQRNAAVSATLEKMKPALADNPWMKMMSGVGGTKNGHNDDHDHDHDDDEFKIKNLQPLRNEEMLLEAKEEKEQHGDEQENDEEEDEKPVRVEKQTEEEKKKPAKKRNNEEEKKEVEMNEKVRSNGAVSANKTDKVAIHDEKDMSSAAPDDDTAKNGSSKNAARPDRFEKKRDEREHKLTLMEAFADDDIVEEFKSEKERVVEDERVKPIDLTLPGWGSWAGADIDPNAQSKNNAASRFKRNRRKRKVLVIHPEDVIKTDADRQQLVRKDKNLEHVIISEKKDTKLAEYQISDLPRQFDSVAEFENKIARPIGRTWNPDHKFRKLIAPKVKTNLGAIIEPIDRDDVKKTIKNSKINATFNNNRK